MIDQSFSIIEADILEIFIIWRLAKYAGVEALKKGLKKGRYQVMAVLLWVFGEWSGGILGVAIFDTADSIWPPYLIAVLGGILGAVVMIMVMRYMPYPAPAEDHMTASVEMEPVISQGFARSAWIPVLVIGFAFLFFCLVLWVGVFIQGGS